MSYNPATGGQAPPIARAASSPGNNATGSTIAALTPVMIISTGLNPIDPSVEADVDAFAGITSSAILNGGSGEVVGSGLIMNVSTSFAVGDSVYVSSTGGLTNVKPNIGSNGWVSGDWIIRLGNITKNAANPANQDFLICIQRIGQL